MTVANARAKVGGAHRAPLQQKHFIIATAGHVDHGKSALVKELTGTDPDRLPEEKARGITIDLGFAELDLPGNIHAGIVDVPGHEDFVRNMIAGVGSVDLALFVIAADDGWMPQTEEHLQILTHLAVQGAVVALTKTDLAKIDVEQIREHLIDTPFAQSPIVRTSVRTGEGIDELKSAIAAELESIQPQRDYGKPRLFIDRVFTLHGIGTVVTGTLTGGQLHRGQKMIIQPTKIETRIRSIQSHGMDMESAQPGMRTAINLSDVDVAQIRRGDVITIAELGPPSAILLARFTGKTKNGSSVYLHHGTSRVAARVFFEDENIARLKLASPIFAFLGDRFVLRDPSERRTIGGGVILNGDGRNREMFSIAPHDLDLCLHAEIGSRGFASKETILRQSHFSSEQIAAELERLQRLERIVICGDFAANNNFWRSLCDRAIAMIDKSQQEYPELSGLDLSNLRKALADHPSQLVDELIISLCANGFARRGSTIARSTHSPALSTRLRPFEARLREALSQSPFDPPPRKEIAPDRDSQQVLQFLIQNGELIEISADILLLRENFEKMKSRVTEFLSRNGSGTVSDLRKALESSRRIMVPLLERLDRDGITQRMGDKRALR